MNKYGAIWRELGVIEIHATSSYQAQQLATELFQLQAGRRKVNRINVSVMLLELDGVPVYHVAVD